MILKRHEKNYILERERQISGVTEFEKRKVAAVFGPPEMKVISDEMRTHLHGETEQNYWVFVTKKGEVEIQITKEKNVDCLVEVPEM